MPRRSIALPAKPARACAVFSEPDHAVWLATDDGQIVTCRLVDGQVVGRGEGFAELVALEPSPDGLGLLIVQSNGLVLEAARGDATRAGARVVADLGRPLAGACLDLASDSLMVAESGPGGRLVRLSLTDATVSVITDAVDDPQALALVDATHAALLSETQLSTVDLSTGELVPCADVVAEVLLGLDGGASVIVADATGALSSIDLATGAVTSGPAVGAPVLALARWGQLLFAVTESTVEAIELDLDEGFLVLDVPLGPAFIGGFLRVEVDPAAAGISPANLTVDVDEGPPFGSVSAGVEPPSPTGRLRMRVLAGSRPGTYSLVARTVDTNVVVGRARFRVSRYWPADLDGPPVAITGIQTLSWGGGPAGPQNARSMAPEFLRVAIVAVDTRDRRTANFVNLNENWRRFVTGDFDDTRRSLRRYIEEASFRNTPATPGGPTGTTVDVAGPSAFGPLMLDGWGDTFEYFNPTHSDDWAGWGPTEAAKKGIPGVFSEWLDDRGIRASTLSQVKAVVFVVQTASEERVAVGNKLLRAKYVWPQAWFAEFGWETQHADGPTTHTRRWLPTIYMPSHLPSVIVNSIPIAPYDPIGTLCHEMGHGFGCNDLYDNGKYGDGVAERIASGADIMAGGDSLAHFSLANCLRFGWVDPAWIQTFDFASNPSGGTVRLQAMETLTRSGPLPGRKAGIEVRIRDGRNYYFEHRLKQAGQMGDQKLQDYFGGERVLIGTDVVSTRIENEVTRPDILMLPKDADGDGAALIVANTDYSESDVTDPERMHDFRVVYEGKQPFDPNVVKVRVEYVGANRPELEISPAPGGTNWKSPDIDVKSPAGVNRVAKGVENTVSVRVHNRGTLRAEKVHVVVSWLPFTTRPGNWTPMADPPLQDIGPSSDAIFVTKFTPPAGLKIDDVAVEHFCIGASVDRYVDPHTPDHNEFTVHNNRAQSNFDTADVASGSPSERRTTAVSVSNPRLSRATYLNVLQQSHEDFRAYVGNAWLRLAPGETRALELAYESLAGDPVHGPRFAERFDDIIHEPNHVTLTSSSTAPEGCGWPVTEWGVSLDLNARNRSDILDVELAGDAVRGLIIGTADDLTRPLSSGTVNVVLWIAERDEQIETSGEVRPDGTFLALVPPSVRRAARSGREVTGEAFYLGTQRWSSCRSGRRRLV